MTRQNLKLHAAFVMLDDLSGKLSIEEITDRLIEVGYIEDSEDDYRQYQIQQARETIREHRKSKQRSGEIQNELVNLWEYDDEGKKVHYFRAVGELTVKEAAQHIRYWDERIAEDSHHRQRYYAFYAKRYGRRLKRQLDLFSQPMAG